MANDADLYQQLSLEADPLDALRSETFAPLLPSLGLSINAILGFLVRYGEMTPDVKEEFHSALADSPIEAFEANGVPGNLVPALLAVCEVPESTAQGFVGRHEILPIGIGIQAAMAFMRTPAGQRVMLQAAQRWAPRAIHGVGDAIRGALQLRP